jgi:hypothetical protein
MSRSRPTFDFLDGLRFFFVSPGWVKHLVVLSLVGLLSCLLVGLPYFVGYMHRMALRRAHGEPPLPPLDDVGGTFKDGLRSLLFTELHLLVFLGPALLCLIPAAILARTAGGLPADEARETALLVSLGLSALLLTLGLILAALYIPAAHARFLLSGRFGAALDVRENLAFIGRNLTSYALMYLLALAANAIANAGVVLCVVGIYPATIWSVLVAAWAEGELIRCGREGAA